MEDLPHAVVVDPRLNRVPGLHTDIVLLAIVAVIGDGGGGIGDQVVDVDPDVVVVDVAELEILDGVELHGEDVVGEVADVAGVEEAKVLAGQSSSKLLGGSDNEGKAVATERGVLRDGGEGEGGGEGKGGAVGGVLELKSVGIEGVANESARLIRQPQDPAVFDLSNSIQADVAVPGTTAAEADISEPVLLGGDGEDKGEECQEKGEIFGHRRWEMGALVGLRVSGLEVSLFLCISLFFEHLAWAFVERRGREDKRPE